MIVSLVKLVRLGKLQCKAIMLQMDKDNLTRTLFLRNWNRLVFSIYTVCSFVPVKSIYLFLGPERIFIAKTYGKVSLWFGHFEIYIS